MTAPGLPAITRRHLKTAAAIAAAVAGFAAAVAAWEAVIWMTGGNQWAAIGGAVVLTAALLTVTGRAI